MSAQDIVALVIVVLLIAYLVAALVVLEKF